jgi:hypothetical protein
MFMRVEKEIKKNRDREIGLQRQRQGQRHTDRNNQTDSFSQIQTNNTWVLDVAFLVLWGPACPLDLGRTGRWTWPG